MVRSEARQFAPLWFKYLAQDEPQKAYQLTLGPQSRRPLDDRLWAFYRSASEELREGLKTFVDSAGGTNAAGVGAESPSAILSDRRSVARQKQRSGRPVVRRDIRGGGERKSFFVLVRMMRMKLPSGGAGWRILRTDGGVRPAGW